MTPNLTIFLKSLKKDDVKGSKTHPKIKHQAKCFLDSKDYEEYELFIFDWADELEELEVHHVLLSLIYDNI